MTNETTPVNDTILVYESEPGKVSHRFCSRDEAIRILDEALDSGSGGAVFTTKDGLEAEVSYEIKHPIRTWVADQKAKLRDDICLRDILDRHNVPKDAEVRSAVFAAIKEIRGH